MSEAAPRRVFFSYGRQEGAAFVERLRAALTALGYACWKDDHEIKDDKTWRLSIYRGLRGTECQRDLAVSHDKIGDVLWAQGDGVRALASYQAGMVIHERLAASDPANAVWQRDLFVSLYRIAIVLLDDAASKPELLIVCRRALDQARRLHDQFPEDRERDGYVEAAQALLNRASLP